MEALLYARDNRQTNFNIRLNWCIEIRKSSPEIGSITFPSFATLCRAHRESLNEKISKKCFQKKKNSRIHIISHQRVYIVMIVGTTLIMTRRWWDDAPLKSRSSHVFTLRFFSSSSPGLCRCCCSSHYQNWKWSLAHSKIVVGWLGPKQWREWRREKYSNKKKYLDKITVNGRKALQPATTARRFFPLFESVDITKRTAAATRHDKNKTKICSCEYK